MTQTSNRLLDEFAKLMTDAAGVAQGVRREVETAVRSQAERFLGDLEVVQREEFEAVRDMAARAREENEALRRRLDALESRLAAAVPGGSETGSEPAKLGPLGGGELATDRMGAEI
jgi:BMFP domain-containing protein YqiC